MTLSGLQGMDSKQPDVRALIGSLATLIEKSEVRTACTSLYSMALCCVCCIMPPII